MQTVFLFAATTESAEQPDLLSALGIDWMMLILQIVAFLILVALLGKYVYPLFIRMIDDRQAKIDEAAKAAASAQESAADAEAKMNELLDEARQQAADIVATARLESSKTLSDSEEKARLTAERIVTEAHQQIDRDVASAKAALYDETLNLVALATEKVSGKVVSGKDDRTLIENAVKGVG